MTYAHAVVLGLVQGITEFLPVSSSGHLILVPHVFGWPDQGLAFDAAMHLGTLAALVAYFRSELLALAAGTLSRRVGLMIVLATIPAGLVGLLFGKVVESNLRSPLLIAFTTAFWGIVMWIADRRAVPAPEGGGEPLERVRWGQGLAVGCAQALALIPGTSRSGATIIGGMLFGMSRRAATEFSFFLAIPTLFAACAYEFVKNRHLLTATDVPAFGIGFAVAFVSAFLCVRWLLRYVSRNDFVPFAWYRIAFGVVIVVTAYAGLVDWS
jgi:undecaprenyl-diphosphatase